MLASIVLLLLLMGIVDFGLLFSDRLAMSNAARGGARWASKHPTSWAPWYPARVSSKTRRRSRASGASGGPAT